MIEELTNGELQDQIMTLQEQIMTLQKENGKVAYLMEQHTDNFNKLVSVAVRDAENMSVLHYRVRMLHIFLTATVTFVTITTTYLLFK